MAEDLSIGRTCVGRVLSVVLAGLVFVSCFFLGAELSRIKPLWNDELFTQTHIIEQSSYLDIFRGHIEEGNNAPLFYLFQKAWCDAAGFRLPREWEGEWNLEDPRGQAVLRVLPNVFMSLAVAVIFAYFAVTVSLWAGGLALLVTLSSSMIWLYWAEARPYALWVFLSVCQQVLLLRMVAPSRYTQGQTRVLAGVHILMVCSVTLSFLQVVAAVAVLWLKGFRQIKKMLPLFLVPLAIAVYYYLNSPHFKMWFGTPPLTLALRVFPPEWLAIIAGYLVLALARPEGGKGRRVWLDTRSGTCLFFTGLVFAGTGILLAALVFLDRGGPEGFEISKRYFIYLAPTGILAVTVSGLELLRLTKADTWGRTNAVIWVAGWLLLRYFRLDAQLMDFFF